MIFRQIKLISFIFLLLLCINGCVEPFEMETEVFESALVIEATVTNEFRKHEVNLSRTYRLEEEDASLEENAEVKVLDEMDNEYLFEEVSPGKYLSISKFKAQPERLYQLAVETQDGRSYYSNPTALAMGGEITDLYASKTENNKGEAGVALLLNNIDNSGTSGYYRYEYEETFEIFSPIKKHQDLILVEDELVVVDKTKEEYRCFKTEPSQEIVLANTNTLDEPRLNGYMVRFLEKGNPAMSHRYSILVKQYTLSGEAYNFYETLKELSESESLFSQLQPGFLNGNVYSQTNPNEKVLGYFSVSAVSSKRTFFNFTDFFNENEERPSYISDYCPVSDPYLDSPELRSIVRSGNAKLFERTPVGFAVIKYTVVRAECVDCTLTGTNKVPEFWEE